MYFDFVFFLQEITEKKEESIDYSLFSMEWSNQLPTLHVINIANMFIITP